MTILNDPEWRKLGHAGSRGAAEPALVGRRWLGVAALAYAALILWMLLYPFDFQAKAHSGWLADMRMSKLDGLGNVLLFVPWGLLAAWWTRSRWGGGEWGILGAIVGGIALATLGDTAQMWLPGRHSSFVDVAFNGLGSALGALVGYRFYAGLTVRWNHVAVKLETRPRGRACLAICILVLLARTYPFDVTTATWDLKSNLRRTASQCLSSPVLHWLRDSATGPLPRAAWEELGWASLSLLLFACVAVSMGQAIREHFDRRGDRTSPALFVLFLGGMGVVATELMQWPLLSRSMDVSELAGGLAGVALGVLVEIVVRAVRRRSNRAAQRGGVAPGQGSRQ
jgi:glycopeptide antibiotics resistance protein